MKRNLVICVLAVTLLWSSTASADVWFELLYAGCFTGSDDDISDPEGAPPGVFGEVDGSIDCFNKDFNGDSDRMVLTIKAFQPWKYGFMFLYYDITGPFNRAGRTDITDNEKGGFFGGITVAVSPKKIAEDVAGRPMDWGFIADVSIKYEMEHVSKFGMLHYYGLHWDIKQSFLDFLAITTVIRDDKAFEGVDLQLGTALQKSFSLGSQDFIFGGFLQWGLFGEGDAPSLMTEGNNFITTQPQLLWDFGKNIKYPAKLYVGTEYQYTLNRYLIEDKSENLFQFMARWNL
jgi:hypothetical protein